MSKNNAQSNEWIVEISSGIGSKTEKEIDVLGHHLNSFLGDSAKSFSEKTIKTWNEIAGSAQNSAMLCPLGLRINPDLFYSFGEALLVNYIKKLSQKQSLFQNAAFYYLNFFRQSVFLKRIYNQKRWENLIHAIILNSNFTVNQIFKQRTEEYSRKTLFKIIKGKNVKNYNWLQVYNDVQLLQKAVFAQLDSVKKQNAKVAFLMENCLNMALLDLACLTGGFVNVMIPANSVPEHIEYILNQTRAAILVASNDKQLAKIKSVKTKLLHLKTVVLIEGSSIEKWVITWNEMLEKAKTVENEKIEKNQTHIDISSLASIMYTSGTTGDPKGIMFSQMNLVYKRFCRAMALPDISDSDTFLAFLPLFHTFGRFLEMLGSVFWGAEYCFMENPARDTMLSNMRRIKPSVFISIPKKWYELYDYIASRIDIEFEDHEKIIEEVKDASGGNLKWGLSAAGFLEPDVFRFFQQHGVELLSGFGMTEATGGITMTPPGQYIENSLGRPLPGIEVILADDGEMLIRGPYVMISYYDGNDNVKVDPEYWLPTGDIMQQDSSGFYEIIDRKKEIYKNIKGETVAPQKIENYFRDFEFVKQVFLVGDHKQFNTVLIYPDKENPEFKKLNKEEIQNYFSTVVVTVNKFLASFERIVDFRLTERAFSEKDGELTPKGTYKRRVIEKNFDPVIQTMYSKNYISLNWHDREIRIPNWFLREKGCLINDISVEENGITIPKYKQSLLIQEDISDKRKIVIGNYIFENTIPFLDFQIILNNPLYWLGNFDIVNFTGNSVYQWYRLNTKDTRMIFSATLSDVPAGEDIKQKFNSILDGEEYSLEGLHLAVLLFQSGDYELQKQAVEYFYFILDDETLPLFDLTLNVISRPNLAKSTPARQLLFKTGAPFFSGTKFKKFLNNFLHADPDLLDRDEIAFIIKNAKGDENLRAIYEILKAEIIRIEGETISTKTFAPSLFSLLAEYGINHPTRYKIIRQYLVRYQLATHMPELARTARNARLKLLDGFRNWLGDNQPVAVDVETGEEYEWADVITFEEEIPEKDKKTMLAAISETSMIREAIFLLSNGSMVRLYDIPPGGIWVSLVDQTDKVNFYRLSVQSRYQGAYDIVLCVNQKMEIEKLRTEINWLIHISKAKSGESLVENFGGHWHNYQIWTKEYYPAKPIERFLEREVRKQNKDDDKRVYHLWPFLVWSAAWAHIQFWRRTNFTMELLDKGTENIVIPKHDYQTGIKFVSIENRKQSEGIKSLMQDFYQQYVAGTEKKYNMLKYPSIWFYIFSALLNSEGEKEGIEMMHKIVSEGGNSETIVKEAGAYIDNYRKNGYIPKKLYFAIRRFERWFIINHDAALSAQARTLNEFYDTYNLNELEKKYPETRTNFFLHTVFTESAQEIKDALLNIVKKQHDEHYSAEKTLTLISELEKSFTLTEKEAFFLARLSYPHLRPEDTAEFITTPTAGEHRMDVVIHLEDYDGQQYQVRRPVSPKEISRLHQIFMESQLPVSFRPEHQFIMAVSDRGHIIGGLFYSYVDVKTVYMEKIVVSNRYRHKGISEGIMQEFFNRLRSEHVETVTTGFFRPEYFYRFGFKVERKYSGLVKDLSNGEKVPLTN